MGKTIVKKKKLIAPNKRTVRSREARKRLQKVHSRRSPIAQETDEALMAEIAPTIGHWLKQPNEWDVPGVDTPIDWRGKYEKEGLKELKEGGIGAIGPNTPTEAEQIRRYEWQKKHPFISAQIFRDPTGEVWDGIRQHEWAQKSTSKDADFGFNVRKPHSDFLDTFGLKRYDIKGMRVQFLPEGTKTMIGAMAFYNQEYDTMFVPLVTYANKLRKEPETERRRNTVTHEVGHHIYNNSYKLRTDWSTQKVNLTPKIGKWKIEGAGKKQQISISDALLKGDTYFFNWPARDINRHWKRTYQQKGMHGPVLRTFLKNEAFAETFRIYRNGDLKRQIKHERKWLQHRHDDLAILQPQYDTLRAIQKNKRTPREQLDFEYIGRDLRRQKRALKGEEAMVDNLVTVHNWMKKYDKNMWKIGTQYDEETPSGKSFRVRRVSKTSGVMAEVDAKAFK